MPTDPRRSPLSPSSSPPTFRPSIRRYFRRVAGARSRSVVPCTAHAVRRVPHRARNIHPSITRRHCARQTTSSAAVAMIPRLTGRAHARPCTRHCCNLSCWHAARWGPSRFTVLEALQNVDHVLTTHGAALPGLAAFGPNTGASMVACWLNG
jgi:hypothetical protein